MTTPTNRPTPVILDEAALEEIEAREAKASSGPWLVTDGQHIDQYAPHPEGNRLLSEGSYDSNYHIFGQDDVEFIAHARTDIPALCATVRALREQLAESDAIIKSYNDAEWKTNTALREQLAAMEHQRNEALDQCTELHQRLAQVEKERPQTRQRPVGWISCGLRHGRDRAVDMIFENAECAKAFIDSIEPVVGPIVAATQMRDQCVAKLRQIAAAYDNQHHQNTGAMISKQAIQYAARQLESLTLNVEQKEAK